MPTSPWPWAAASPKRNLRLREKVTSGAGRHQDGDGSWPRHGDRMGHVRNQDEVFLGRSMVQRSTHMSDETQQVVDAEVKRFVEEATRRRSA